MTLGEAFAAAWAGTVPDPAALERALTTFVDRAQRAFPELLLDREGFCRFIAPRIDTDDPAAALAQLRAADLWVAYGCLARDPKALEWFRNSVMSVIHAAVARQDPAAADDAYQALYCRLFLPDDPEATPKIHAYDGRRELGRFIRTLARNSGIDQLRARKAMTPLELDHVERIGQMLDDHETSVLRRACWAEFKAALADAFAQLEPRQRNVLRCHLQGLTAQQIGRIYKAHRVTVARWLAAIRFALLESTREGLRRRLAGDEAAVDSIVRMVELDLTASLTRLVGESES